MLGRSGVYERTAPTLPGQVVRIEGERGPVPDIGRQTWTARAIKVDTGRQAGVLHHEVATVDRARFSRRRHR
ncbi:hypothetical protein EIL87_21075 [Saccharopolyspora rhizosphaerae]|uniref:Uncharacterized protein n=1 Tax=Saccharopolyspora rhizosphaerae TaxID=2492662 RepID=A0A426JLX6_9PSEU|nr:hypothetical protein [Saccharopolyspora rhizosphaerae]RRO14233.1 hypothetical protein EIL87_21075 [Saccharopolyspora rhizosphaerae]